MPSQTTRRAFVKLTAAVASVTAVEFSHATSAGKTIALIIDPDSTLTPSEPIQWAAEKFRQALTLKGITSSGTSSTFSVIVSPINAPLAKSFGNLPSITQPETTALIPGNHNNAPAILVTGMDARGIVYGLLELTERIRLNDNPITALHLSAPVVEITPNKVRSVARAFLSEIEDKSWFYDRNFWQNYLDTLASARFNRFNFALGFGYDFPRGVTGDYLHFPYPYLVEVPGYEQVNVVPRLQPGERQRNLETLQYIAAETARRGLNFQLGIWTHAYQWTDSPNSDHHIIGLTPETHAAYCRDALAAVLKACPQITGLTLRIHGESGIPEGSYPFWQTLFEAISGAGRVIEIDMHAKGLNQVMIDMAHKTGMPVKAGAKFWAEHLGLGYQQADIRETEYPRKGVTGTFAVSNGERNFTRYGYGDFYGQHSDIEILYRAWPGTQRHLLWGDPALAAGYGRAANFCGAAGMELCEPLTFKGREGSGHPGGRNSYADSSLADINRDTNKFAITYLLWGRYLYNPAAAPEAHHRYFRHTFGSSGPSLEIALASSSRILPLISTAWLPSASNHSFWPELYTPVTILPPTGKLLYSDSPAPHNVSAMSPLDPQLFSTIDQHAKDLVSGTKNARYSPSEVTEWLETMVRTSTQSLAAARASAGTRAKSPEFRQVEEDILILNGLGRYYANLFRSALFYSIHEQTADPAAAAQSLAAYSRARDAWANMAERTDKIYSTDISYGDIPIRRGNWADRVSEIDHDLTTLEKYFADKPILQVSAAKTIPAIKIPSRPTVRVEHVVPDTFRPGSDLDLTITIPAIVTASTLWYRHVNHGERWLSTPMQKTGSAHSASVPGSYTNSLYPLQYYFELHTADAATLHPPFNTTLSNQPYYTLSKE
ncbi:MAG TPA: hypothetical protein VIX90_11380 [Edaphobacter sp.]